MPHDHHHDHHHHHHAHGLGHSHAPKDFGRTFAISVGLNLAFSIIEAGFGFFSGSLSLVADAGHNLSDVLGLLLAWGAVILARRNPTQKHTYGMRRSSILAALFNAIILLVAIGAIAWAAIGRLINPAPVAGNIVVWVALIGILINGFTAYLFLHGSKSDLNIRGAYLHMVADTAVSVGVVVTGFAIVWSGWRWIDPIVSLIIVVVIFWGTWELLVDSFNLALDAVPEDVDVPSVRQYLENLPDVSAVHDLHIWALSTTETALTAHLVRSAESCNDTLLATASRDLREKFEIAHITLQCESEKLGPHCIQAPDDAL